MVQRSNHWKTIVAMVAWKKTLIIPSHWKYDHWPSLRSTPQRPTPSLESLLHLAHCPWRRSWRSCKLFWISYTTASPLPCHLQRPQTSTFYTLRQLLKFLDTQVSLAPSHVCVSVGLWHFWISILSASLVALLEKLKKTDPNYLLSSWNYPIQQIFWAQTFFYPKQYPAQAFLTCVSSGLLRACLYWYE